MLTSVVFRSVLGGGGQHTTHKRGVCRYTTHVFHEQKHMNSDMKLSVTASDVCLV